MRTIGEILQKARIEKKYTLEEIEGQLRIRKKFLQALEDNNWSKLPSLTYIKGFLRNYSAFLGLKPDEMVAIFRRQYQEQEKSGVIPKGLTHPLNGPLLQVTSHFTIVGIIICFIIFFFGYLFIQYKNYTNPPGLIITAPQEGEVIQSDKITLSGKTDNDAVVSVNDQKIAITSDGEFSTSLTLPPGINTIAVESVGKNGKKRSTTRTIQIKVGQ